MKNILILIVIFFCNSSLFSQQECFETLNTTTTDWRDSNSINTWNWTQKGSVYPVYLNDDLDLPTKFIALPYFHKNVGGTGTPDGYHNVSNYLFKGQNKEDQDINPEDGWELLMKDFGNPNTAPGNNTGVGRSSPYFILYNRYNGKMKIFVALFGYRAQQSSIVRIGFANEINGETKKSDNSKAQRALFNYGDPIIKTVVEFNPILEYKQLNQIQQFPQNSDNYQWMVAELITSYDPCTCTNPINFLNYKSILHMQVVNLKNSLINAKIDGKITQQQLVNGNSVFKEQGGFSSFYNVANKAGQKGYDNWNNAKGTADKIIDYGNKALQKELIRAWYKKDNIFYTSDDPILNDLAKTGLRSLLSSPDSFKIMLGIKTPNDVKFGKFLNSAKGITSALPYVGAAIGIIDLLVNGGEKQVETPKIGPVVFDVSLKLSGKIEEENMISEVEFYTPGSPTPSNTGAFLNSIYNNTLGVFNILELPELEFAEILPTINSSSLSNIYSGATQCENNYFNVNNFEGATSIKMREYRPKTNIKYVLNPASNLKVESIEAAIVLDYSNTEELFISRPDQINQATAIPYHDLMPIKQITLDSANYIFIPDTAGTFYSSLDSITFLSMWTQNLIPKKKFFDTNSSSVFKRILSVINSQGLELEYVSKNYPYDTGTKIRFRTKYVPITCFNKLNFMLLGANNFGRAFVKLFIKLKRKNLPNSEPLNMILTYDYTSKLVNASIIPNITGSYEVFLYSGTSISNYECCFKCSTPSFYSHNRKNFYYGLNNFKLKSIPFDKHWYVPQKAIYNNQNLLTVKEILIIPETSVIPANSVIKAGGNIIIEKNVTIGANSQIISGTKIDIKSPNVFNPKVEFKIQPANEILFNCSDVNYENLHNSVSEINQFCNNKTSYISRVFTSNPPNNINKDYSVLNEADVQKLVITAHPNPSNDIVNVSIFAIKNGKYTVELTDLTGKVLFKNNLNINEYNGKIEIPTAKLSNGVYVITVFNENEQVNKKLLVQHD